MDLGYQSTLPSSDDSKSIDLQNNSSDQTDSNHKLFYIRSIVDLISGYIIPDNAIRDNPIYSTRGWYNRPCVMDYAHTKLSTINEQDDSDASISVGDVDADAGDDNDNDNGGGSGNNNE